MDDKISVNKDSIIVKFVSYVNTILNYVRSVKDDENNALAKIEETLLLLSNTINYVESLFSFFEKKEDFDILKTYYILLLYNTHELLGQIIKNKNIDLQKLQIFAFTKSKIQKILLKDCTMN